MTVKDIGGNSLLPTQVESSRIPDRGHDTLRKHREVIEIWWTLLGWTMDPLEGPWLDVETRDWEFPKFELDHHLSSRKEP